MTAPPVKPVLAEQYPNLNVIYRKLDNQNNAIYLKEQDKGKQRKKLQDNINELASSIDDMKQQLSGIVQDYGFRNVKEFLEKYEAAQTAYGEYQRAAKAWKNSIEHLETRVSVLVKLEKNKQKIRERDNKSKRTHFRFRDRDAR